MQMAICGCSVDMQTPGHHRSFRPMLIQWWVLRAVELIKILRLKREQYAEEGRKKVSSPESA
jgi:hypothetical protein